MKSVWFPAAPLRRCSVARPSASIRFTDRASSNRASGSSSRAWRKTEPSKRSGLLTHRVLRSASNGTRSTIRSATRSTAHCSKRSVTHYWYAGTAARFLIQHGWIRNCRFPLVEHDLFGTDSQSIGSCPKGMLFEILFQPSTPARFSLSSLPARCGCFCTRFLCAGGNRRNCTERIGYADCAGLSLTEHSMLDEASHWNVFIVGPPSAKHRAQAETGGQRHQTVDPADAGDGLAGRGDDERAKFHHISFHYPGCGSESA